MANKRVPGQLFGVSDSRRERTSRFDDRGLGVIQSPLKTIIINTSFQDTPDKARAAWDGAIQALQTFFAQNTQEPSDTIYTPPAGP